MESHLLPESKTKWIAQKLIDNEWFKIDLFSWILPKCVYLWRFWVKCIHFGKIHANRSILNYSLSINFWAINLIFDSGKRWNSIFFNDKSFLPPQKFFTPLFEDWKSQNFVISKIGPLKFRCKKGGVKNFWVG